MLYYISGLMLAALLLTTVSAWFASGWLSLVGRLAALGAVVLFVVVNWPRVKPLGGYAVSQNS